MYTKCTSWFYSFFYILKEGFLEFEFLNFTNFIKNGENSIVLATIVRKFPLCLICLQKI